MADYFGGTPNDVKTDRNNQEGATENLNNVFSYAMPQAKATQAGGLDALSDAQSQYARMANGGRAYTAEAAAPATNAIQDQADAARKQEASLGTGRGGGTVEADADAGAGTTKAIDDTINKTLATNKATGTAGLASTGGTELSDASNLLGLGANSENAVMNNAGSSRQTSENINRQNQAILGSSIGSLVQLGLDF